MGVVAALLALAVAAVVLLSDGGAATTRPSVGSLRASGTALRHGARARQLSAGELAAERAIRRLLKLGLPVFCGGRHGHALAFTFDDGPGPYTALALEKLAQAHERATFFVVGRSIDQHPGFLGRELKLAAIGDHTFTHPQLTALTASAVRSEIARTAQLIERRSGRRAELFRPPYGLHNAIVDRIAKQLGLLEVLWSVDSADSRGANYAQIRSNVEAGLRPGAIVLMHENRGQTIRALTALLPTLRRRHLHSVSVPELLASDPPSASELRAGFAGCATTGRIRSGSGG